MNKPERFLLAEYELLKKEIEALSKELRDVERYSIVMNAIIWGWLAANQTTLEKQGILKWLWFIPVATVVIGYIRTWSINIVISQMGDYIRENTENYFVGSASGGWEHYLQKQRSNAWWRSSSLFWFMLFTFSTALAVIQWSLLSKSE